MNDKICRNYLKLFQSNPPVSIKFCHYDLSHSSPGDISAGFSSTFEARSDKISDFHYYFFRISLDS